MQLSDREAALVASLTTIRDRRTRGVRYARHDVSAVPQRAAELVTSDDPRIMGAAGTCAHDSVSRTSTPNSKLVASVPVWAQVAAAMLVLGVSASIANLEVRYDIERPERHDGLVEAGDGDSGRNGCAGGCGDDGFERQRVSPRNSISFEPCCSRKSAHGRR